MQNAIVEAASVSSTPTNIFSWVQACGGPDLEIKNSRDVKGLPEAEWWVWDWPSGVLRYDELHRHSPHVGGSILITLKPKFDGIGCDWSTAYQFADEFPARASGSCESFWGAHSAATEWRPEFVLTQGIEFWKSTRHSFAEWQGTSPECGLITIEECGEVFNWRRGLPSGAQALADMLHGNCRLDGVGFSSLEDAVADALSATDRLRTAAAEILFTAPADRALWSAFNAGVNHARTA